MSETTKATLEQLKNRDYTLIVDKSASMLTDDCPGGISRWKSAQEATLGLSTKMFELDPDGISFYAFAQSFKRHDNVKPNVVANLWTEHEPNGGTVLATVLKDAVDNYFFRKERNQAKANGELIMVITDGQPQDESDVAKLIVETTKRMDRDSELGISFIQVGRDNGATLFLKKLDDDLQKQGAKFDIVDTITIEEMGNRSLSDVLISALND